MTISALDLAGARTAMTRQLMDAGLAVYANDQLDQGLRLALAEYGVAKPRRLWAAQTFAFTGSTRFIEVGWLTAAYRGAVVRSVWRNYDPSLAWPKGMNGASEVKFNLFSDGVDAPGTPTLELEEYISVSAASATVVVQFDYPVWLLKDLDSAAATTFMAHADHWLVHGACGHAAMMRAHDLAENVGAGVVTSIGGGVDAGFAGSGGGNSRVRSLGGTQTYAAMSGMTGNYGAISALWLKQFREWMLEPAKARGHFFRERDRARRGFYDAETLEVI